MYTLCVNKSLQNAAQEYNRRIGLPPLVEGVYVPVDECRVRLIANAYEKLPVCDADLFVEVVYRQFAKEVCRQFLYVREIGIVVEPWPGRGELYQTSVEMYCDVETHRHLFFFTGGEPHPFLSSFDMGMGVNVNEQFRAVHDIFGHAAGGFGFGPRGEENSWLMQSQMFSPLAQRALTTETRGQSAWFNFGSHLYGRNGVLLHRAPSKRPFARQKMALLPAEFTNWQAVLHRGLVSCGPL